jgi:hypothetical protein
MVELAVGRSSANAGWNGDGKPECRPDATGFCSARFAGDAARNTNVRAAFADRAELRGGAADGDTTCEKRAFKRRDFE